MTDGGSGSDTGALVGVITAALAAAAFWGRKLLASMSRDSTEIQRAGAETDLIVSLRRELKRLSDQNDSLAEKVNLLQKTIIDLNDEIGTLRTENRALTSEISTLRTENAGLHREVVRLQAEISALRQISSNLSHNGA